MYNVISDDITIVDNNIKIEQVNSFTEWVEFYNKVPNREKLPKLEQSLFTHANDNVYEIFNEDTNRKKQNVYFARATNGEILGFCSIYLYKHYKKEMLIDALWVDHLYRKMGTAKQMLNHIMQNNTFDMIKAVSGSPESEKLFNRLDFSKQETYAYYK